MPFSYIKNWSILYQNTSTVAGFMMKACVIYLWKGKSAGMKNIHGVKPASVTGSCYSRWRPDAVFIHIFLFKIGTIILLIENVRCSKLYAYMVTLNTVTISL